MFEAGLVGAFKFIIFHFLFKFVDYWFFFFEEFFYLVFGGGYAEMSLTELEARLHGSYGLNGWHAIG